MCVHTYMYVYIYIDICVHVYRYVVYCCTYGREANLMLLMSSEK